MILHYYGANYSLQEVRKRIPVGRDGATIRDIIKTFDGYGIMASAFHVTFDETKKIDLPVIVNWNRNHYVIVEKIIHGYFYIVDSNIGRIKMSYEEFEEGYSGIAILLKKTDEFRRIKRSICARIPFAFLLRKHWKSALFLVLLSFFSKTATLGIPIVMQCMIDAISNKNMSIVHGAMLVIFIIFAGVISSVHGIVLSGLGVRLERDTNKMLMGKLLRVPYLFYDKKSNSQIFYALDNVSCVKNIYLDNLIVSVLDVIAILFILGYLFCVNKICFIITLLILIPNILFWLVSDSNIQQKTRIMVNESGKLSSRQIEIVYSILGIKAASMENSIMSDWTDKYKLYYNTNRLYQMYMNMFSSVLSTMMTLSPIIVLVFASLLAQKGVLTIGLALALYSLTGMMFNFVNNVLISLREYRNNRVVLECLEDIVAFPEENYGVANEEELDVFGEMVVDHISFSYSENGVEVLKDISFRIPRNSKVALVGNSGSGKSSLLKVLSGLYSCNKGKILYNNNLLDGSTKTNIRKQIGFVTQNSWIMNKSIKDNIAFGLNNVSDEEIIDACKIVNVHDEIMSMPMGYQTIISETGKNVSGGQCQRIILARIVLLDPKILLLDEATSALDLKNEERILDYFSKKQCTIIMTTHRKECLEKCDSLLFMQDGTIEMSEA